MGSPLVRYQTATMVYVGTKSKISLLLVVIGVCSVSGYELDEKVERNFPEDMKNYARALVTDIYQPGEGLGYMAKMIKKGMNERYPDEDWHVVVGRYVGLSSEVDEDYRRFHLRIKHTQISLLWLIRIIYVVYRVHAAFYFYSFEQFFISPQSIVSINQSNQILNWSVC